MTKEPHIPTAAIKPNLQTALDILNEVLEQKGLTRTDIEVLVERIIVDKDRNVDIYLKHGLGNLASEKGRNGFHLCEVPGGEPERYGLSYAQEEVCRLHGAFA